MNYYELSEEEQTILDAVEQDNFVPVAKEVAVKQALAGAAQQAGNKTRNINIRVSERVVLKLKAKAAREGIPYQTLAASILHRNTQ